MDNSAFVKKYKSNKGAVWIKVKLTSGDEFFYDTHKGWLQIKERCDKNFLFISDLRLQYRSHEVKIDIEDCEGIYLIRSVMGQWGASSREYYTFGTVKGNSVAKKMYMVPELVIDKEYEDPLEDCFAEAIIYDQRKIRKK